MDKTDSASETGSAEARGRIRTAELILIMVQRRNRKMQIFVDADACPVVAIIEKIAKENSVPVTLLCDTNHVLSSAYSEVVVVGAGADAVDYKLISKMCIRDSRKATSLNCLRMKTITFGHRCFTALQAATDRS